MNQQAPAKFGSLPQPAGVLLPGKRARLITELLAGVTLAALALPLNIGYAESAGLPAIVGINAAIIPAIAFLCTAPFYVGAVTSSSLAVSFVLFLVPTALGLVWLGPVLSAIQHVVPPGMRATASAIFLFVNNLIGIGLGSVALGALSDVLSVRYGADSLRYAILAGTSFYFVAAGLFLLSAKRLEKDWE